MMNVSEAIQTIRYRISNKDIVGMESNGDTFEDLETRN